MPAVQLLHPDPPKRQIDLVPEESVEEYEDDHGGESKREVGIHPALPVLEPVPAQAPHGYERIPSAGAA